VNLTRQVNRFFVVQRLSDRGSAYLDLLRGCSALTVMLGHVRGLFFVSFGDVQTPGLSVYITYFLTSIGHEAVIVFFVLSGYFVGGNVLRSVADGSWSWRSYLSRRLTRLYIVLIPALILGGIIDIAGVTIFGAAGPYGGDTSYKHIVSDSVADRLHISVFVGNAVYLQEILVPTFGSNGPLWSLSYEFWFYLLFPYVVLAMIRASEVSHRLLYGGLFLTVSIFIGPKIFAYFFIWLLGAAAIFAPAMKAKPSFRTVALGLSLALCLGTVFLRRRFAMPDLVGDALLALPTLILVYILANGTGAITNGVWGRLRLSKISHGLAGFSYTLYLVHLPVLIFLHAAVIWSGGVRWQPDLAHGLAGIGIAVLMVGYAWTLSQLTEARTRAATAYLLMALKRNKSGPPN
jgi:peptidoglycan/LPS O-acetylase OafA/YrhL